MNHFDIALAFGEGLALIASPCILPVLPLILAASADGGRRRPYGVILGFILSFSLFALLSRQIVLWSGIGGETIRTASLFLLALFGLALLWPGLAERLGTLTRGLADLGQNLAGNGEKGLLGGIAVGALIGLVWTPCAGPILAAVLVQVIRQQTDLAGAFVILAFAFGAGLPMLAIALVGRSLLDRLGFLFRHLLAVRRAFGLLILGSVAYLAAGASAVSLFAATNTAENKPAASGTLAHALPNPYPAPEFSGIESWLNSAPLTLSEMKGKVVLVDFWTYSCINCLRTLPYLKDWDAKYRDLGLTIVGVHAPEFEFEKKLANVQAAVAQYGIRYPVALDNRLDTWSNFRNRFWPAHYLIDRSGQVVYTHFGEGNYDVTENNIRFLLGLDRRAGSTVHEAPADEQTAETYLGFARAERFLGAGGLAPDVVRDYRYPQRLQRDTWALNGAWRVEAEKIVAEADSAALQLDFHARKVFLVLGTRDGRPRQVSLRLDGQALAGITVTRHALYELTDLKVARRGTLEVRTDSAGLEAYAFTFGS